MHYYERNIGDYHRKAGRLNILQHGVYNLLIDACYDRETFPTLEQAIDWTWAETEEEIEAVKFVLRKFFKLEDGTYVQNRIKEDLENYWSSGGTGSNNAGKEGNRERQKRFREERQQIFAQLKEYGITPSFNAKMTELRALLNSVATTNNVTVTDETVTNNDGVTNNVTVTTKPITIEPSNQEPNDSSSGNNAHEEKIELPPVQFATYQIDDQRHYSLLEFVNQYSQFQSDFVELAYPRYPTVLSVDFQALMQGYCDHFAAKNGKNTPSIWFVKWLSWIQNNLQDVINRREKQQVPNHQSKQPTGSVQPQKSYFERIADEENENSIRDVTPKKLIGVEECGHA